MQSEHGKSMNHIVYPVLTPQRIVGGSSLVARLWLMGYSRKSENKRNFLSVCYRKDNTLDQEIKDKQEELYLFNPIGNLPSFLK